MGSPEALPEVNFAVKPADQIEAEAVRDFEKEFQRLTGIPKSLGPADPTRLVIQNGCQLATQLRVLIDTSAKANLIKYTRGPFLDNVAGLYGELVTRLDARAAKTILRFALTDLVAFPVIIEAGTRCAGAAQLLFETDLEVVIQPNAISVDVAATCTVEGIVGNGFTPGQINSIVNWTQAFGLTVVNLETTEGGTNEETDEHMRFRTWLAPESQNTCGCEEGYQFWAYSTSPAVTDVAVWSAPAIAGEVWIYPLMDGGRLPTQAEMDEVYATVSARKRRPMTDFVTVKVPEPVEYQCAFDYWIYQANEISGPHIRNAVEIAMAEWVAWTRSKIGRDIMPSNLTRYVMVPGVKRIAIDPGMPDFVSLIKYQLGVIEPLTVPVARFQGYEDD
jgi:phage-related baseplate assembly protein